MSSGNLSLPTHISPPVTKFFYVELEIDLSAEGFQAVLAEASLDAGGKLKLWRMRRTMLALTAGLMNGRTIVGTWRYNY